MKVFGILFLCIAVHLQIGVDAARNLICYYDSASYFRSGLGKFPLSELEVAAQFCTHLVYGYAGLNPTSFEVHSLNVDLDMFHYHEVTALKLKYPYLKIYLSVGGDHDNDPEHPLKYVELLERDRETQQHFIDSALSLLRRNGFDGLDLAFQFPRNKPRKVHSTVGMYWKMFKKLFTGNFIVDEQAEGHRKNFTEFARNVRQSFGYANLSLSLTVLPNVNSSWYFDVPQIKNYFEFINLAAFDFLTPERNPEEADYTAPIFHLSTQDRLPHYNVEFQVSYWLQNQCPPEKLNLGIATYGRAWKLSTDSGQTGYPVVAATRGPAEAGPQTHKAGLLSWPEICPLFKGSGNYRGAEAPLRKVTDLERSFGNYAYRPADENGEHGVWVSFDDPDFGSHKANYVKNKNLGGMALFDLSLDDFRGLCTGQKLPILRSVKYSLS